EGLVESTNKDIAKLGSDLETMLKVLGVDEESENYNYFQQALRLYNPLLNDPHSKQAIKKRKETLVKEAKGGKLNIDGKYTYILPDWYAVMESIFLDKEPKGLLKDGQVYCNLYSEGKVDCLRSPSLSFEHVVRQNTKSDEMKDWFITKGVHVSCQDMISKILQADWDGDKILITPSKILINAAERNIEKLDVVPLEYEMGVAPEKQINPKSIYDSLVFAFKGDIGTISNNISKIYNSNNFDYESIKKLTSYNNHVIDMAKTLDLPKPPQDVKKKWNEYKSEKLPYFFQYAKNKSEDKVKEKDDMVMNRIEDMIQSPRITFRSVAGKFDYKNLMKRSYIPITKYIVDKETDEEIIKRYIELDQNKSKYINKSEDDEKKRSNKKKVKHVYRMIRKQLLEVHNSPNNVTDVLVRYLYNNVDSSFKTTLWESFGKEIVANIKRNVYNIIECVDCKEEVEKQTQRQLRCYGCQEKRRKTLDNARKTKKKISA
ncbi:MAG TPA: hypothetical protein VEY70_17315, partial [Metabacillus sp.]|nr:hypothetical protein [Metabacillus sp.]